MIAGNRSRRMRPLSAGPAEIAGELHIDPANLSEIIKDNRNSRDGSQRQGP
jgi:hypothetical protein